MKLFDLVLMVASFGLAAVMFLKRATVSVAEFLALRVKVQNFVTFSLLLLVWQSDFSSFWDYTSRRLAGRWDEVVDIVKATTLGNIPAPLLTFLFHISLIMRSSWEFFGWRVRGGRCSAVWPCEACSSGLA